MPFEMVHFLALKRVKVIRELHTVYKHVINTKIMGEFYGEEQWIKDKKADRHLKFIIREKIKLKTRVLKLINESGLTCAEAQLKYFKCNIERVTVSGTLSNYQIIHAIQEAIQDYKNNLRKNQ